MMRMTINGVAIFFIPYDNITMKTKVEEKKRKRTTKQHEKHMDSVCINSIRYMEIEGIERQYLVNMYFE